jgi:hypothetical protein
MGIGIKDSGRVFIDHCVFYGNVWPVKCYEKNLGRGGGNAIVKNSILSNSSEQSYFADSQSSLHFSYCLSDNDALTGSDHNILENPLFSNPTNFDYSLLTGSPCILAGDDYGEKSDMGIDLRKTDMQPGIMIKMIFINSPDMQKPEFLALYNPSSQIVDMSDYKISRGVTATIPEGTYLNPFDILYLTDDLSDDEWNDVTKQIFEWEDGKLSNNGEALQLDDNYGIPVDFVRYENNSLWPSGAFVHGEVLSLISSDLDNHFAENWISVPVNEILGAPADITRDSFALFPNPAKDKVIVMAPENYNEKVMIFSLMGVLLDILYLDDSGYAEIDLSKYRQNITLVKVGKRVIKVVRM